MKSSSLISWSMRLSASGARWLVAVLMLWAPGHAPAYTVSEYEEAGGLSIAVVREPDGDVYGGGFESGVWLRGTPIFGEIFGHWLANRLQDGNYYSIGITFRLMPRSNVAPFVGAGGSYNGLTSERNSVSVFDEDFREADRSYWKGHAEAGLRLWFGSRKVHFLEGSYRQHWTDTGTDFDYGWASIEYGQLF